MLLLLPILLMPIRLLRLVEAKQAAADAAKAATDAAKAAEKYAEAEGDADATMMLMAEADAMTRWP